ncbi:MAG: hypothetical protein ACRD3L_03410 [Terriglobales bacterium]
MQLTDHDLSEFMEIWSDEFQEAITLEDARLRASLLLELYLMVVSPRECD